MPWKCLSTTISDYFNQIIFFLWLLLFFSTWYRFFCVCVIGSHGISSLTTMHNNDVTELRTTQTKGKLWAFYGWDIQKNHFTILSVTNISAKRLKWVITGITRMYRQRKSVSRSSYSRFPVKFCPKTNDLFRNQYCSARQTLDFPIILKSISDKQLNWLCTMPYNVFKSLSLLVRYKTLFKCVLFPYSKLH